MVGTYLFYLHINIIFNILYLIFIYNIFCRGLDVSSTESSREISDVVFTTDVKPTKHQRPLSLGK